MEQLRPETDLDVNLDEVLLLAIGRVDAEVHAISVRVSSCAAVAGPKCGFEEFDGAFPGKGFDRGAGWGGEWVHSKKSTSP
jgi:hypothetical protein